MFWCSFYTVASSFSHIEGGGFHSRGGARKKFYPVLRGAGGGGGGAESFSYFVIPAPRY